MVVFRIITFNITKKLLLVIVLLLYKKYFRPDRTKQVLEDYLDDFNMNSSKEMKLVFFQDAIDHVSRLAKPDNCFVYFLRQKFTNINE